MSRRPVTRAVLPIAGLGTRLLPATKATPKEMLPVVDRPAVQHVVAEALQAGIRYFVFVTGRNKTLVEDHFDRNASLEAQLEADGKTDLLAVAREAGLKPGQAGFIRQQRPKGLGHAVLCAREAIGDHPFAVLLPDMIARPSPGGDACMAELAQSHRRRGGNWLSVTEIPPHEASHYGIVAPGPPCGEDGFGVDRLVEKPPPAEAPSNLMILGRYILEPRIFDYLERQAAGTGGEIQLTDAIIAMHRDGAPLCARQFFGQTHDCGSLAGLIAANVVFAMDRPDLRDAVLSLLRRHGLRLDPVEEDR